MKRSVFSLLCTVLILLHAGLSVPALADTVTLKNGKVLDGTITKETADAVTIEMKEKGITDVILCKRADIASIVKEKKKKAVPGSSAR